MTTDHRPVRPPATLPGLYARLAREALAAAGRAFARHLPWRTR